MSLSAEFNADNVQVVDKSVLFARLDDVNFVPHFLSRPIVIAATKTIKQLRIVLISSLFDADKAEGSSALGTTRWDEVQSILTYIYVQATKVAQEMNKILMDVDVLLQGEKDTLPLSVTSNVDVVFRVSTERDVPAIDRFVPEGSQTIWIPPSEDTAHPAHTAPNVSQRQANGALPIFYPVVALGGTFDHLHAGHKILLSMAAWIARDKLIVGMTDDALLQKKANKDVIQSLPERIDAARSFLQLFRPNVFYDLVPIDDVCGPTGWDPNIQALVVSRETMAGAEIIDKTRREKSLPPLRCFVIDVISHSETNLDIEDAEALRRTKMSSTFIREWIVQQRRPHKP